MTLAPALCVFPPSGFASEKCSFKPVKKIFIPSPETAKDSLDRFNPVTTTALSYKLFIIK
jgi:hypothetical protein